MDRTVERRAYRAHTDIVLIALVFAMSLFGIVAVCVPKQVAKTVGQKNRDNPLINELVDGKGLFQLFQGSAFICSVDIFFNRLIRFLLGSFQGFFILVHIVVCTFEYRGYTCVIIKFRHAAGNNASAGTRCLCIMLSYFSQQFFNGFVIVTLRNYRKLVATDAEDRAVLKDVADNSAGFADALVSGLVAVEIIDRFQVVYVQDRDGERRLAMLPNLTVHTFFHYCIGMPVFNASVGGLPFLPPWRPSTGHNGVFLLS